MFLLLLGDERVGERVALKDALPLSFAFCRLCAIAAFVSLYWRVVFVKVDHEKRII